MDSELRVSNHITNYSASEARLSGNGWCSGQLGTNIFDPYIEVDFGRDVLLTSVTTEGLDFLLSDYYIERYRIQVAREDASLLSIALSINNSKPEPVVSTFACMHVIV